MNDPKLLPAWGQSETHNVPAEGSQTLQQPPYLTNNWRMILAADEYVRAENKYVRVHKSFIGDTAVNVASIINRGMIVRCPVPHPEGFYTINSNNELSKLDYEQSLSLYRNTKDVETLRPEFERLDSTPPFTKEDCAGFIEFLNHVRQENKNHLILLGHEAAFLIHRQDVWYKFPYPLPVKGDGQVFCAYHLKLAFTEMLRYDYVFIGRDNRFGTSDYMPLVIGLDWSTCALVFNKHGW